MNELLDDETFEVRSSMGYAAMVPFWVFSNVSPRELTVYVFCSFWIQGGNKVKPTPKQISEGTKLSVRAVNSAIEVLKSVDAWVGGWISYDKREYR